MGMGAERSGRYSTQLTCVKSRANTPEPSANLPDWPGEARRVVKGLLARDGVTYATLAERLQAIGVDETEYSIANKMARGTFPLVFLLQCMRALGRDHVTIEVAKH